MPNTRIDTGGYSPVFIGFTALAIVAFVTGLVILNWPPITRGFDSSLSLGVNLMFWAVANLIALYLLFFALRRAWTQYSTRFFDDGVRQFTGTRVVFIRWSEVVEVRRSRGVFEVRGPAGAVRIDQDFYSKPSLVQKLLQESVPAGVRGRRSTGKPVPRTR
jgi:hypothetical protein